MDRCPSALRPGDECCRQFDLCGALAGLVKEHGYHLVFDMLGRTPDGPDE